MKKHRTFGITGFFLLGSIILLAAEILIALYAKDAFIRGFAGDVIVVMLIYSVIRTFVKKYIRLLPFWVFVFAALYECLQMFNLPELLGVSDSRILTVILGTTFDVMDIAAYFSGMVILFICQFFGEKRKR